MQNLDPSYIRYIYDSIKRGEVSVDNEASIPDGLIGMFEDAFNESIIIDKRQESLNFFAFWALLKKDVSVLFVSDVLQIEEIKVFEFLNTYSSWFNSPESGKYSLYHERLRIYFLQKLGEKEVQRLNQRIINRLQKAISDQNKDEFEIYALQFLSDHLIVEAFADETKGKELLDFTKNELIWNRQIKISNQFTWTKNTIQNTILWTSKYQPKESVFGYLDLVELHHKEQNDAENIVALVANNEIDLALKRIETFGGDDQEGLQRKFILYMICFMELTLLESKTQTWRKEALEKILKHLDEQMPVDHSILNWNDFFSSYLVFKVSCVLSEMDLDFLILYKKTQEWDSEWIEEIIIENQSNYKLLLECAIGKSCENKVYLQISKELAKRGNINDSLKISQLIADESVKFNAFKFISTEIAKLGEIDETLQIVQLISDESVKCRAYHDISIELIKLGNIEEALQILQLISDESVKFTAYHDTSIELIKFGNIDETLQIVQLIRDESVKCRSFKDISTELVNQGNVDGAFQIAKLISDESVKFKLFQFISTQIAKTRKIDETLQIVQLISDESVKFRAYHDISIELIKLDNIEEALQIAQSISDESVKNRAFHAISTELTKFGKIENAFKIIQLINDESEKNRAYIDISIEFAKQGKINDALELTKSIKLNELKSRSLMNICIQMSIKGSDKEALECARGIYYEQYKCKSLCCISSSFYYKNRIEEAETIIQEAIDSALLIKSSYDKSRALREISIELVKQEKLERAFECARHIIDDKERDRTIKIIYKEFESLVLEGVINDPYQSIRTISSKIDKNNIVLRITTLLAKKNAIQEAKTLINTSLYFKEKDLNVIQLNILITKLNQQNMDQEAYKCIREIKNEIDKIDILLEISHKLIKQSKLKEAFQFVNDIREEKYKSLGLFNICNELAKQKKFEESFKYVNLISSKHFRSRAFLAISSEQYKFGNIKQAKISINQSIESAKKIISNRSMALLDISNEMSKLGNYFEAKTCANYMTNSLDKIKALLIIYKDLAYNGNIDNAELHLLESISCAKLINDDLGKISGLLEVFVEIVKNGNLQKAKLVLDECLSIALMISDEADRDSAYSNISEELAKLGKYKESVELARKINDEINKDIAFSNISVVLAEQGMFKESIECLRYINEDIFRFRPISSISIELVKKGLLRESLKNVKNIDENYFKFDALSKISEELTKQGKIKEALKCCQDISEDSQKSNSLEFISIELARHKKWSLAESISLEITLVEKFHSCWKEIAKTQIEDNGAAIAFETLSHLQNEEVKKYYLKGWAENVTVNDLTEELLLQALPVLKNNPESIEHLLQTHAIKQLFFGNVSKEQIHHLNKTLNIQWAMDIKHQIDSNS